MPAPAGPPGPGTVLVRRAADRFVSRSPGITTWHCFSFGPHYDPAHVAHGPLVVHDEHLLEPAAGFPSHPHRDLQIVSWVLEGELVHEDEQGTTVVPADGLQRTDAATGVVHSERAGALPTRFVQLWLTAPTTAAVPSYEQARVPPGDGLLRVLPALRGVHLYVARVGAVPVALPDVPMAHLYVGRGAAQLAGQALRPGDSARLTEAGPVPLTGSGAEVLLVTSGQA